MVQELIKLITVTISNLKNECDELIIWENQNIFKNMEDIVGQINHVFTIILTNKNEFEKHNIYIDEAIILSILTNILVSMENQDVILLLDTLDNEVIPILEELQSILNTLNEV